MSHIYHLACGECFEVLYVGKIVYSKNRQENGLVFGGWRDQNDGHWIEMQDLAALVERWLILHRGHEVRLVSEAFLDRIDDGHLRYIESEEGLLSRKIDPEPDDYDDADLVPDAFLKR